jgi:hypothetical protein
MARSTSNIQSLWLRDSVDEFLAQSEKDSARAAGDTDIKPRPPFLTAQDRADLELKAMKQWNEYIKAVATLREKENKTYKDQLDLQIKALDIMGALGKASTSAGALQNGRLITAESAKAGRKHAEGLAVIDDLTGSLTPAQEVALIELAGSLEDGSWGDSLSRVMQQDNELFVGNFPAAMARLADITATSPAELQELIQGQATSSNEVAVARIFEAGQRRHGDALADVDRLFLETEAAEENMNRLIMSSPELREAFGAARSILTVSPGNEDATLQALGATPGTAIDNLPNQEMFTGFIDRISDIETEPFARDLFTATAAEPLFDEYLTSQGFDPAQLSTGQREAVLESVVTQRRREQGRDFVAGQAYNAAKTLAALTPGGASPTLTEVLDALIFGSTRPFKLIREVNRLAKNNKRVKRLAEEVEQQADQGIIPPEVERDLPRVSEQEQEQAAQNIEREAERSEAPAAEQAGPSGDWREMNNREIMASLSPEAQQFVFEAGKFRDGDEGLDGFDRARETMFALAERELGGGAAPAEATPESRMPNQAVVDNLQTNADRFGARPTITLDSGEEVFVLPEGGGKLYQMVDGQPQEYAPAGAPEPAAPAAAPQPTASLEQAGATNVVSPAGDPYGPYGQFEDGTVGFMRDGELVRVSPGQEGYDSIRSVLAGGEALPAEGGATPATPASDGSPGSLFSSVAKGVNYTPLDLPDMPSAEELLAEEEPPRGEEPASPRPSSRQERLVEGATERLAVATGEGTDPFAGASAARERAPTFMDNAKEYLAQSGFDVSAIPSLGPEEANRAARTAKRLLAESGISPEKAMDVMGQLVYSQNPTFTSQEAPEIRADRTQFFPEEGAGVTEFDPVQVYGDAPRVETDFSAMGPEEAIREAQVMNDYLKNSGLSEEEAYQEMERRVYSKNPEVFGQFMRQPMGTQEDIERLREAGTPPERVRLTPDPLEFSASEIVEERQEFDDPVGDSAEAERVLREDAQRRLRMSNPTNQNPSQEAAATTGREVLEPEETSSPSAEAQEEVQEAASSDVEDAAVEATETPASEVPASVETPAAEPAQADENQPEEEKKEEEEEEEEEKKEERAARPDYGGSPPGGRAPANLQPGGADYTRPGAPVTPKTTVFEQQQMGVSAKPNPGASITAPPNLSNAEVPVQTGSSGRGAGRKKLGLELLKSANEKAQQLRGMQ